MTPPNGLGTPGSVAASEKLTRNTSCALCAQRKVKCDKKKPACSNCLKAKVECVATTPAPPRRRKRKLSEIDAASRLRRYEHLLKTNGIEFDDDDTGDDADDSGPSREAGTGTGQGDFKLLSLIAPKAKTLENGALFTDEENSHYVENPLWNDDFQYPKAALHGDRSDEEEPTYPDAENLLVGHARKDVTSLHPAPVHIFRLWQTFLTNVNPLVKIFHAPTVQQMVLDASGNLEKVSRPIEALMFAIYFIATRSLDDAECQSIFGESRQALLTKYCHAAQQALINAKFLRSLNISTLQALVLFVLGTRRIYDPHSVWILTGVAVRIGQRLGLHRDGSEYKMSPFDAEMRRRTWWQIIFLDGHASKLTGARFPMEQYRFDTKPPLNISDSDLNPAMKQYPEEKQGATEMMFCCLRNDIAEAIKNAGKSMKNDSSSLAEKDKAIDELDTHIRQKYGRYCDKSIPLHLVVSYVIKSVICTMRIMAHHPRQYTNQNINMPQGEKDFVFSQCLEEMELDGLAHTVEAVKGFRWHILEHFQIDAFIYMLSELQHRTSGEMVEKAWKQVATTYDDRPELITNTKNPLYWAMGNLTLRAWRKREESGIMNQGGFSMGTPRLITQLRAQRNIREQQDSNFGFPESSLRVHQVQDNEAGLLQADTPLDQWTTSDPMFEMKMPEISPLDWEYWNSLMDGDLPNYYHGFGTGVAPTQW